MVLGCGDETATNGLSRHGESAKHPCGQWWSSAAQSHKEGAGVDGHRGGKRGDRLDEHLMCSSVESKQTSPGSEEM